MTDEQLAAKGCEVRDGVGCRYRSVAGYCPPCAARHRIEQAAKPKEPKPTPVCSSCGFSARDHVEERMGNHTRRRLLWQPDGVCASWGSGSGMPW